MIDAMASSGDHGRDWRDEARALYEHYIDVFNARDEASFTACFHVPVTITRLPAGGDDGPPVVIDDATRLWPVLPAHWTRSTIDELRVLPEQFTPRPELAARPPQRVVLEATVTRWAGDDPYEQVHVLYVLARRDGRLGIQAMVPLAVAGSST